MNLTATAPPTTRDALEVLSSDHRRLETLFKDYDRLTSQEAAVADRQGLLARIGALLQSHAQMEEELFYTRLNTESPKLQKALADHAEIRALLQEALNPDLSPQALDDTVAQLRQTVLDHVAYEEETLFAQARVLDGKELDLKALGTKLTMRRAQLLGDQGAD